MKRNCPECGTEFFGRIDKKYCSDHCRNAFNNRKAQPTNNLIRRVNRILRNNRNILNDLNPHGTAKTTRSKLLARGFNFSYCTNTYVTKKGKTYYFCYDMGYLELENDYIALVVRQEYID